MKIVLEPWLGAAGVGSLVVGFAQPNPPRSTVEHGDGRRAGEHFSEPFPGHYKWKSFVLSVNSTVTLNDWEKKRKEEETNPQTASYLTARIDGHFLQPFAQVEYDLCSGSDLRWEKFYS